MSAIIEDTQPMNAQGMNAQGVFSKPDFTDPISIKMDSAKKMSLADKTGNEALKREAAAEQSFADRMGGRSALSKKKSSSDVKTDSDSAPTSPKATSPRGMLKSASQPVLAHAKQPGQVGMLKSQSSFRVSFPQTPTATDIPVEAINLKMDAAAKQSLADRTGDIRLKQAASAEQSLADKLGATAASRLDLSPFKASEVEESSAVHVPLPIPTSTTVPSLPSSSLLHTCSCCGFQEPFNGGNTKSAANATVKKEVYVAPKPSVGSDSDKWLRGQKIPSREELAQKGKSAFQPRGVKKEDGSVKKEEDSKRADSPKASRASSKSAPASAATSPTITIEQPSELQLKPRKVNKKNKGHSKQQSLDSTATPSNQDLLTKQSSSIPEPALLSTGTTSM